MCGGGGEGGGPNPRKISPSLPHGSSVGGSIPLGSEQNLRTVGEGGGVRMAGFGVFLKVQRFQLPCSKPSKK